MTPFSTYQLVDLWHDGLTLSEATAGDTLADAIVQISHRTKAIIQISYDGQSWSIRDASQEAALEMIGDALGEPDDLDPADRDFINMHRPGDLQDDAVAARDWYRQARGL